MKPTIPRDETWNKIPVSKPMKHILDLFEKTNLTSEQYFLLGRLLAQDTVEEWFFEGTEESKTT